MNSASSLHRHPPHERIQLYSCTRRIAPIPPPSRRLVSRASLPAPRWWDRRAGESPTVHHRPRPSKDASAEDSQLPLSSESLPPNREPQRGGGKVSDPGQPGSSSLPLRATRHKLSAPTVFSPPAPRRWIRRGGECPPPSTAARPSLRKRRHGEIDSHTGVNTAPRTAERRKRALSRRTLGASLHTTRTRFTLTLSHPRSLVSSSPRFDLTDAGLLPPVA